MFCDKNDRCVKAPCGPRRKSVGSLVVTAEPTLRQVVLREIAETVQNRGWTVKIVSNRLRPGTTCSYRFFCEDSSSSTGRTGTLPTSAKPRRRRGVANCPNHAAGFFAADRSATGQGLRAMELVSPSITSPGVRNLDNNGSPLREKCGRVCGLTPPWADRSSRGRAPPERQVRPGCRALREHAARRAAARSSW